jgi:hypothetical protein
MRLNMKKSYAKTGTCIVLKSVSWNIK